MAKRILIDTCGWIDFLRSRDGVLGDYVSLAIEREQAVLCGVVIAKLLQGTKGKKEQSQLDFLFSNIEIVPTDESCWQTAGIMLQQQRVQGITIPLTDGLIAAIANNQDIPILTIDKHFEYLPVKRVELS